MTARRPPKLIRFHHANGDTFSRTPAQLARDNGTTIAGALQLVDEWLEAGDVVRRPDGGLDVIRYRPPKRQPAGTATVTAPVARRMVEQGTATKLRSTDLAATMDKLRQP